MQYKTKAHQEARKGGYECAQCDRDLSPAKYEGEFTYAYTREGHEQMTSVYLRCRCGCLNDVSIDITDDDGFMNRVDEIVIVPHRATKITQEPAMAEAT
jgi:hypothetical protein